MKFNNLLRIPDDIKLSTDTSPLRFEENTARCRSDEHVHFIIDDNSMKIIVYPCGDGVKFLRLRFDGNMRGVTNILGAAFERCTSQEAAWKTFVPHEKFAWYFHTFDGERLDSYGVKTGCDSFAFWQCDPSGITLWLDLRNGNTGTKLMEPLLCADIVLREGVTGEDPFIASRLFCRMMCTNPNLAQAPIYGFNNWYWAYGAIDEKTVIHECEYLGAITSGFANKPFMVIDDGWQRAHAEGYNGGPWNGCNNSFFGMEDAAAMIAERGCRPGIWFRPLLTKIDAPSQAIYDGKTPDAGKILDPSHPFTLEQVATDTACIAGWGYKLIKHDFTTYDLFNHRMAAPSPFYDRTKTNAQIIKNLYITIQKNAGNAVVLGCNTINHLAAGIHQAQRVGDDTSGRSFEWTRRNGIHSLMLLPQNGEFFTVDPDCAAFTDRVSKDLNFDFLEASAMSGCAAFASVKPGILTPGEEVRMSKILRIASTIKPDEYGTIADWTKTSVPSVFVYHGKLYEYDWYREYGGCRNVITWKE